MLRDVIGLYKIPLLPWNVVGFVTHLKRFVNGLEINCEKATVYF